MSKSHRIKGVATDVLTRRFRSRERGALLELTLIVLTFKVFYMQNNIYKALKEVQCLGFSGIQQCDCLTLPYRGH